MSTRAEQIAAVKRVIEECVSSGYDDFQDDPHTFGHLTSMRSVLATLEGMQDRPSGSTLAEQIAWMFLEVQRREMTRIRGVVDADVSMTKAILATLEGIAAPPDGIPADILEHEYRKTVLGDTAIRHAGKIGSHSGPCKPGCPGDSPSPQQPTQEARGIAESILWHGMSVDEATRLIDRFAAQRVTAAPSGDVVEWAHQVLRDGHRRHLREPPGGKNLTLCEVDAIAAALTAATDKARREALREAAIIVRSIQGPTTGKEIVAAILALSTPQNPGDAAPEEEGGNG